MRLITSLALLTFIAPAASARQYASQQPRQAGATVTSARLGPPGGFLAGTDDCNALHRDVGTGDLVGVPVSTGTTGPEGQNEASCYAFGTTGIDHDVWFDWTADWTADFVLETCSGPTFDSKIAVWPFSAGCPTDGTSIACNDNGCNSWSSVRFSATSGTRYTFQIGSRPGQTGGSGSFKITRVVPMRCGTYDDGTTENAIGLTAGGETGWLHFQDCLLTVDRIETAYSTTIGSCPTSGDPSRIACYEDPDCDGDPTTPAGGMTLMWSLATTSTNECTDILNPYPYPGDMGGLFTNTAPSLCTFVMATAEQFAGGFPAPMDQTNPTPNAWVVGQTPTGATLDLTNLNNNNVPPLQTDAIGFPTAWLLRAQGTEPSAGVATCFGDAGCPCGNDDASGGGCANSTGVGAILATTGTPSLSVDSLVLRVHQTTNQPGIFFQGNVALAPPLAFGGGLRCCGTNVVRIGTYLPTGGSTDTASGNRIGGIGPPVSQHPGNAALSPGDSRCYQWWYRDPAGGTCSSGFNLSNAALVTWSS